MRTWADIGIEISYGTTGGLRLPCPRCASPGPHVPGPGGGPHHARLVCSQCGAFVKWLPKPRPVAQEVG